MKKVRPLSFIFKLCLLFLLAYLTHNMPEARRKNQSPSAMAYQRGHTTKPLS